MSEQQGDYLTDASTEDRAHVMPLHGKYYGTVVTFDTGYDVISNTFWYPDGSEPSERQLANWNMTLEEARADLMMSDNHYETNMTFQAAKVLVDFLNGKTIDRRNPQTLW